MSVPELARIIFPSERDRGVIAVIAAYFDESAAPKRSTIFTIAGYFGLTEEFLHLESLWEPLLTRYGIEYFRAADCENGTGPFEKFRDRPIPARLSDADKARLREIKTEFVAAIGQVRIWGVGVNVVVPDFLAAIRDPAVRRVLGDEPYFIAAQLMLSEVGMGVKGFNDLQSSGYRRHSVGFVFDDHREYRGKALKSYSLFQEKNPESSTWMASLTYADDKKVIPLQAADNFAYEVMKWGFNATHEPSRRERIAMTELKQRTGKIYRLDKQGLDAIIRQNIGAAELPTATVPIA